MELEQEGNNNLLGQSARIGDLETIKSLVEQEKVNIDYGGEDNNTALHIAAANGRADIVEYLILKGVNINATNYRYNNTPAALAALNGCIETFKIFLKHGAKIDLENLNQTLLWCAEYNELETIKLLVELHNTNINSIPVVDTALHRAASRGHYDIVMYLIFKGANINVLTLHLKETPLFFAVRNAHIRIAELLIQNGAKIGVINIQRENIFDAAIWSDRVELIDFVLENNFNIDQYNPRGFTPLLQALRMQKQTSVEYLLKKGANYKRYSIFTGQTPLHCAIDPGEGSITLMKLLLDHVGKREGEARMLEFVNHKCAAYGRTALHIACFQRNYSAAKLLLHCGANPFISDKRDRKPYDLINNDIRRDEVEICDRIKSIFHQTSSKTWRAM